MAFASRIGNALRKTSAPSSSPLLQAIRCMSSSKLFVGGISYNTNETTLKDAFSNYGDVLEARIITERESGRSKGFGFIMYSSSDEAAAAITAMNGKELDARIVSVNYANDRAGGIRGGSGFNVGGYGGRSGYATDGYGSSAGYGNSGGYGSGGHGNGRGYGASGYGSSSGKYAGNGGYSGRGTGTSQGSYTGNDGYSDGATSASRGGYPGEGGYNNGATGGGHANYNYVPGNGYVGGYSDGATDGGSAAKYNSMSSGGSYASGNGGYRDGATGDGYARYYNNASGGRYAGGHASNYNNASGGGYGSSGSYNTGVSSDGNAGGYSSPNTYGSGRYSTGVAGGGTLGEFDSTEGFGSTGNNNGNNFAANATGSSYNHSSRAGRYSDGEAMDHDANKVQYNGQDDLLGVDFFDEKEAVENR